MNFNDLTKVRPELIDIARDAFDWENESDPDMYEKLAGIYVHIRSV